MKKLTIGLFVLALAIVFACSGEKENTTTDAAPATKTEKKIAKAEPKVDGKGVYQKLCIACHGAKGDMGLNNAAKFTESELSLEERIHVLNNGRAGTAMVSYANLLSEAEIKAVCEYTITLKKD